MHNTIFTLCKWRKHGGKTEHEKKKCEPICSNNRNRTLDSTRHVHVLLSFVSELTVVFIGDVKLLVSFCLKSFSWSSDVFKSLVCFQRPRGYKLI